ncbi:MULTISPECIES: NrfD/PsrC family molybdoenzyme membrane anchor subunit [Campylobacter]|uniref:NrfD/PsrC family molybdoenzyme membrane anchor subunit n=1 Tax=Campylobacter TaxID=194 RepID=UPI0003782AB0|nr:MULTISPECIES: NrfD/PsrC family molybdoenzyme membrane anchor subunit [Campylobacter]QKF60661.1 reductase-associated membrane protein [Campylobacter curvus]UEB48986.1 polysulfide reductase NrfD [Campylobacter curvus]
MLQSTWGWLIAIYLFLGGLGAGAFLCSTLAYKGFLGKLEVKFYRSGFLLAPALVIAGTVLLLFDLAPSAAINPLKILQLYTRPVSMMSIGTYLLTFFIVVSLLVFLQIKKGGKICDTLLTLGSFLAIGVMGYTGLLLYAIKAIPLWASVWLPILFTVSAISTGFSANAVSLISGGANLSREAHKFHAFLALFEIFAVLMLFASVRHEAAGMLSIDKIVAGSLAPCFWIGFVLLGLVAPVLSGAKTMFSPSCKALEDGSVCCVAGGETKSCIFTEIGVLIGGFCLRAFIIFGAVYIF